MSSERIGPPEQSTAYTPKPIGERRRREEAASGKRKKKSKRRKDPKPDDEERPDDAGDSGEPPHLVDILTAGKPGFRIET